MRVILYTGKGGVGKTSVAAATACKLAAEGRRVIVMSTDQAHSLGDSFETKLGSEPAKVAENLDAMEIDVVKESEQAWGNLQEYLKQILTSRAEGGIEAEELLIFPGLEELFSLFKILDIYEAQQYDVMIVDCAPTGETMSLLKFPEMFGGIIKKILPMKRKMAKTAGSLVERMVKITMPKDRVFADIERLLDKLDRLQELMLNTEVLSIRIVTTAEKIVIKEAKRNFTCLHLYHYNVDAIIVNKVYPPEALEGYFNKWVNLQEEGIRDLKESFHGIPMFFLMLQPKELKGLSVLGQVSGLYGEVDPGKVLFQKNIFRVYKEENIQKMEINLPFADKTEMNLEQRGGEIQISIKNEKRCLLLPDSLKGLEMESAKLENGLLTIEFGL